MRTEEKMHGMDKPDFTELQLHANPMRPQTALLGILVVDANIRIGAFCSKIKGHSHDILLVGAMLRSIGEERTVICYVTVVLHTLHIENARAVVKSDVQPRHMAFSAPDNPKEVGPTDRRKSFKFPAALRGQSNKYSALIVIVVYGFSLCH